MPVVTSPLRAFATVPMVLIVVHLRGDSPTLAALDPEFGDTQAPGIGFAIPSDTVQQVADRLIGGGL